MDARDLLRHTIGLASVCWTGFRTSEGMIAADIAAWIALNLATFNHITTVTIGDFSTLPFWYDTKVVSTSD